MSEARKMLEKDCTFSLVDADPRLSDSVRNGQAVWSDTFPNLHVPGARFSKVQFSGPESHNKNLMPYVYRAVLFTQVIRAKLVSMQSLMPIHCFLFEIQIIKNGFTGPTTYRVFRETGPWATRTLSSFSFLSFRFKFLFQLFLRPCSKILEQTASGVIK